MKKMIFILTVMLTLSTTSQAMSYEDARREALFLTDKMAYELNLSEYQYEAAYEINLDYLMSVNDRYDVYGTSWRYRNRDMRYVLLDWQWNAFCAATHFYRPLYWSAGRWNFCIYARYHNHNLFYFARPAVYITYKGGHGWNHHKHNSYYLRHQSHYRKHNTGHGMRDRFDRGEKRNTHNQGSFRPHNKGKDNGHKNGWGKDKNKENNRGTFGNGKINNGKNNGSFNRDNRGNRNGSFKSNGNGRANKSSDRNGGTSSRNNSSNRNNGSFGGRR